jgi:KDO2-lipid IV(A) lauroyltransferase
MGHPMGMVIRRLDNRRLDDFVNGIRCMHGNRVLHKDDFARGLLTWPCAPARRSASSWTPT